MRHHHVLFLVPVLATSVVAASAGGCGNNVSSSSDATAASGSGGSFDGGKDATLDSQPDAPIYDGGNDGHFCTLPGSIRTTANGQEVVPGGQGGHDLLWLKLPPGFCAHWFANVGNARQMRFAPGGELFVASPTTPTTSGGSNGKAAIVIVPDDDADGYGDAPLTFLAKLPSTQGLLFSSTGYLYYQDGTTIKRIAYKAGQRTPSGPSEQVADITIYTSGGHWPKSMDEADDGTIYVANGGDQGEACDPAHPFHGGILKLDGSPGGTPVAKGLRNPISLRCAKGHNRCFATELAKDYSAGENGREKLLPIRQGDDWGFPCCATKNLPYTGVNPVPDCSGIAMESDAFYIGGTPFGVDFETGNKWPAPWTGVSIVALHGANSTWTGARLVAITMDANTGLPNFGADLDGGKSGGAMSDFATGWDDMKFAHGRPTAVTFSPDGRLFLTNDTNGDIIWIAPLDL